MRRLGLVLCVGATTFATAALSEASKIEKLVASEGKLCFSRVYDAAHLRAHPQQKVERLFVMLAKNQAAAFWEDPNLRHSEESPRKHAEAQEGDTQTRIAALFTLRGMKKPENASGWCNASDGYGDSKSTYQCGGECDHHIGGLRLEDASHVVLDGVEWGVLMDAEAEEADQKALKLGADDRSFKLERRPTEECLAEANKTNSPYASLGAPLRERLKADVPFCYGRDYAPAHLASHPGQATTSIRVWRDAARIDADRAKNLLPDWPDGASVKVSATTRKGGKSVVLTYVCSPMEDQWECSTTFCKADQKNLCDATDLENMKATGCETGAYRTIYLRRGEKEFMMLGNPNTGLQLDAYCGPEKKTATDDRVYRLEPMPLAACADK